MLQDIKEAQQAIEEALTPLAWLSDADPSGRTLQGMATFGFMFLVALKIFTKSHLKVFQLEHPLSCIWSGFEAQGAKQSDAHWLGSLAKCRGSLSNSSLLGMKLQK